MKKFKEDSFARKRCNSTVEFTDEVFETIETLSHEHGLSMGFIIHAAMKAAGVPIDEDDVEKNPSRRRPLGRKVQGPLRRIQFKITYENQKRVRNFLREHDIPSLRELIEQGLRTVKI